VCFLCAFGVMRCSVKWGCESRSGIRGEGVSVKAPTSEPMSSADLSMGH
jgi:hypothetical protein